MVRFASFRRSVRQLAVLVALVSPCAAAQDEPVTGNVRVDYARVLNVEPVYETLRATRTERVCDSPAQDRSPPKAEEGRLTRMWDSVKGVFGGGDDKPRPAAAPSVPPRCRTVLVGREFQRPIAYDVDYMYKGMKYRSRLAEDPGTRLRIRISVTPYESAPVTLP